MARERYGAGRGAVEVIVADNGSTDGTAAVAGAIDQGVRRMRPGAGSPPATVVVPASVWQPLQSPWGASPSIALRWPDGATTAMLRSGKAMRVRLS